MTLRAVPPLLLPPLALGLVFLATTSMTPLREPGAHWDAVYVALAALVNALAVLAWGLAVLAEVVKFSV